MRRNLMQSLMSKKSWIQFGAFCTIVLIIAFAFIIYRDFFQGLFHRENTVSGVGEPRHDFYSAGHIMTIFLAVVIAIATAALSLGSKKHVNKVFIALSIIIVACTVTLLGYSIVTGIYNIEWYMPFHVCNAFTIIIPLCAIFKKKIRAFFMDYLVWAGLVGCFLAVLFPMTTQQHYAAFHIVSLAVWLHHIVMMVLAIYLICSGTYRKFNWFNVSSVLAVVIVTSAIVNVMYGTNFLFLNNAYATFPINIFQLILGDYAVWIVLSSFIFIGFGLQFVFNIFDMIKNFTVIEAAKWVKLRLAIDDDHASVKFVKNKMTSMLSPEVIEFIKETTLENITDPSYVYTHLKELGFFEDVLRKLSWRDKLIIRSDSALATAGL
jgi:uncharacterized membrane protein YwaF